MAQEDSKRQAEAKSGEAEKTPPAPSALRGRATPLADPNSMEANRLRREGDAAERGKAGAGGNADSEGERTARGTHKFLSGAAEAGISVSGSLSAAEKDSNKKQAVSEDIMDFVKEKASAAQNKAANKPSLSQSGAAGKMPQPKNSQPQTSQSQAKPASAPGASEFARYAPGAGRPREDVDEVEALFAAAIEEAGKDETKKEKREEKTRVLGAEKAAEKKAEAAGASPAQVKTAAAQAAADPSVRADNPRQQAEIRADKARLEDPKQRAQLLRGTLVARGLTKNYRGRRVVNGVSFGVRAGEAVGILGPNGAGKTTCFYMVTGLVPADGGIIEIDGFNVTGMPMYRRARLGVGYLPQEASIFRGLSVEDNIKAVLEVVEKDKKRRKQDLDALLDEFKISHLRKSQAIALSGGERRRLEIARALASRPNFMLLDEPFAGIDPIAISDIQQLVRHLTKRGIGVLITDHNVRETLGLVDRAYIIHAGQVLTHGRPDEIVANRDVRRLYLGDSFAL